MQVAEVLSDLTSLRACGNNEALALVNVHKTAAAGQSESVSQTPTAHDARTDSEKDHHAELSRAKELVDLHYGVKIKHLNQGPGLEPVIDEGLRRAREEVNRVLREVGNA